MHVLRTRYGRVFVTVFPNLEVPWKPLSIQEWLAYEQDNKDNRYPPCILEDEIFLHCVLDANLRTNINKLSAGIVSTVAQNIIDHSGPRSVELTNVDLDLSRQESQNILHQLVLTICRAFSAYKPEDVYAMDYDTFMLRVAQAEQLLLEARVLAEPITIGYENQQPQKRRSPLADQNLKELWERQFPGQSKSDKKIPKKDLSPEQEQAIRTVTKDSSKPLTSEQKETIERIKKGGSAIFNNSGKLMKRNDLLQDRINMEKEAGSFEQATDETRFHVRQIQEMYKDVIPKLPGYQKKKA